MLVLLKIKVKGKAEGVGYFDIKEFGFSQLDIMRQIKAQEASSPFPFGSSSRPINQDDVGRDLS